MLEAEVRPSGPPEVTAGTEEGSAGVMEADALVTEEPFTFVKSTSVKREDTAEVLLCRDCTFRD